MKQCYQIRVRGKVQGVGFRRATQEQARKLGVWGFVRNESDGSVYMEVEGPPSVLNSFIQWCHQGPTFARVDQVDAHVISATTSHAGFTIQY